MAKEFQLLEILINKYFCFNPLRTKCLTQLIMCMIKLKTVNLSKICHAMISNAKPDSNYRRLQRFISLEIFSEISLAKLIVAIKGLNKESTWKLTMDRTNWKFGKLHINILYLGVCCNNCAIPLFFTFLKGKKSGNSNYQDRIGIVELFIKSFGKEKIDVIFGDREFIGDKWLNWLESENIKYVIRVKEEGQYISNSRGKFIKAQQLLHSLKAGASINLGARILGKASKSKHFLSAYRCPKTLLLLVVVHSKTVKTPCHLYKYRWQIETMFKAFKSSGFNMEDTHITDYRRLSTLFGVMAIAFAIAYDIGDKREKEHQQILKKHGYKQKATFRIGLDLILHWFMNCKNKLIREFKRIVAKVDQEQIQKLSEVKSVM